VLYGLQLPNQGFSIEHLARNMGTEKLEINTEAATKKDGLVLRFNELDNARLTKAGREVFEGQSASLTGMFWPLPGGNGNEFTLFRLRMTCCAADSIPLKVRIISPEAVLMKQRDWVKVEGRISFSKVADRDEYVPVIILESADQVKPTTADNNEYEQL